MIPKKHKGFHGEPNHNTQIFRDQSPLQHQKQHFQTKQYTSIPLQEKLDEQPQQPQEQQPSIQHQPQLPIQTTTTTTNTTTTTTTNLNQSIQTISRRYRGKDVDNENVANVTEKSRTVQEYQISFDPPQVPSDKRRRLMREFLSKMNIPKELYFYNDGSIFYSPINITINSPHSINGVQIYIKKIKEVNYKDKSSTNSQFLNIITKNPLKPWGIIYESALKVDGFVLNAPKALPIDNKLNGIKWAFVVDDEEFRKPNPRDRNPMKYTNLMKNAINRYEIQFFFMLIPQNQPNVYQEIKRKSLVELKVLTQCIFPRTFYKGRSVTNKLKQQVIAKLGFAPWGINQPIFNGVIPRKTMTIGIDVGHNSDMKGNSVVGFVATIDDNFHNYFSSSFFQKRPGKEIIDSLEEATKEAMLRYYSFNSCLPELVIVYSDGVGDGMLDIVKMTEIAAMKKGFAGTPSSWGLKPKLMYVIVKKNTNARFFTDGQTIGDPPPGTLVDSKITHLGWYDFFLVSQVSFNGSVNPTHYHVLLDEQKMPSDFFQLFTFQMCHLYFNFEKSIRVPAICQFAHKMAFLIGGTVFHEAASQLSDKLFFL
ncbi:hypothetical protein ACTFIV_008209 [Dictyostelium citrinum]